MFVIDFEQVDPPKEAFIVIPIQHLNAQSQEQKHLEKVWKGEIIQRKMPGGNSLGGVFGGESYCPEGNYLGVIVRG